MRRIVLLVTGGVVMAAMMVASAMPAFAKVERLNVDQGVRGGDLTGDFIITPSDRVVGHLHFKPAERQGGGGGGATHHYSAGSENEAQVGPDVFYAYYGSSAKGVETPSGNFNTTFHGVLD